MGESVIGDFVLIIGDFYIPQRAADMPPAFRELLQTDKIKTVLCTGNVSKGVAELLRGMGHHYHVVKGDLDDKLSDIPDELVVDVGSFKVGLIGGHQIIPNNDPSSLGAVQRKLGVDILVSGHSAQATFSEHGAMFISPGSATGCPTSTACTGIKSVPSFMLMAVQDTHVVVYVYEEVDGETKVQMHEHRKTR